MLPLKKFIAIYMKTKQISLIAEESRLHKGICASVCSDEIKCNPWRSWSGRTACTFGMVAWAILLIGCQSSGKFEKLGDLPTALESEDFAKLPSGALAPGDVVKVVFPGAPEFNQAQKIRADGKMSLPVVGEISAAGKRLAELQDELTRLYKPELKNPEVLVSLEASSLPIYVNGAVARPGRVSLDRPMTLLEAIMEAGGVSNIGTLNGVRVIRNSNGQHYTQSFNLSSALKGRSKIEVFYLKPYDMIFVPERFF